MDRGVLNLIIDVLAAALLTALVASGYVLWFALPPGSNRTLELFGWSRHDFGTLHAALSVATLAVLAVHAALHWRWLVTNVAKRAGLAPWASQRPTRAGICLLALAAVPVLATGGIASWSVRERNEPRHAETTSAHTLTNAGFLDRLREQADDVLVRRCASCHGADAPAAGVRCDATALIAAPAGAPELLVRGAPDSSPLLAILSTTNGPHERTRKHRLHADELSVLRAWIGAMQPATQSDRPD